MDSEQRFARLNRLYQFMQKEFDALPSSPDKFKAVVTLELSQSFARTALGLQELDQAREEKAAP